MNRNQWKFQYGGAQVASAAQAKLNAHKIKFDWWENKKKEVMKQVAESGIEVQDSVASSYSNVKGAFGPQIKIDAGLQRDLSECQEKIMEHHGMVKEYEGWIQVLSANATAVLDLNHDDYLFFFGK